MAAQVVLTIALKNATTKQRQQENNIFFTAKPSVGSNSAVDKTRGEFQTRSYIFVTIKNDPDVQNERSIESRSLSRYTPSG